MESWSEADIGESGARLDLSVELDEEEAGVALDAMVGGELNSDGQARKAVLEALDLVE